MVVHPGTFHADIRRNVPEAHLGKAGRTHAPFGSLHDPLTHGWFAFHFFTYQVIDSA
jgi:hypothetical protein